MIEFLDSLFTGAAALLSPLVGSIPTAVRDGDMSPSPCRMLCHRLLVLSLLPLWPSSLQEARAQEVTRHMERPDTFSVCLTTQDGVVGMAATQAQDGDTLVYLEGVAVPLDSLLDTRPSWGNTASDRPWFRDGRDLTLRVLDQEVGNSYSPSGTPEGLDPAQFLELREFDGLPVLWSPTHGQQNIFFLTSRGCSFQRYAAEPRRADGFHPRDILGSIRGLGWVGEDDWWDTVTDRVSFPWPPPQPSTRLVLPSHLLPSPGGNRTLRDVDAHLRRALASSGYSELGYYAVREGFAIATRMERTKSDGEPAEPQARWASEGGLIGPFSIERFLQILIRGNPGRYRIYVFVVTPSVFATDTFRVPQDVAELWFNSGMQGLPWSVGKQPFTEQYTVSVLVYEFLQQQMDGKPNLNVPSSISAEQHLRSAGIWHNLQNGGGE